MVALSWTASVGAGSYRVYRATTTGGPYTYITTVSTTSYTNDGLNNATTYYYVVKAVNGTAVSAYSNQASATTLPLAAPMNLSATAGSGQVALTWTASPNAISYNIYRAVTNGGPYNSFVTNVAGTSYTNTGLTNGATYYYVVRSVNSGALSANSNQATATPTELAIPANLTATPGSGQVVLAWNASAGATGYKIYRSTTNGGPYNSLTDVTTTSYTNTGLANGTTYYYVVKAQNAGGISANSNQASAMPVDLMAPVNLAASAGYGQVALTWDASANATSYNIYRSATNGGPYTYITNVSTPSYINASLSNATAYYYVVKAQYAQGLSAASSQASATTLAIAAPTNLAATAGGGQIALSWTASPDASSYNVYRSTTDGGPYSYVTNVSSTNYVNTGLSNGTTYFFVVRASNSGANSANSNQAGATPQVAAPTPTPTPATQLPATPANLTASAGYGQVSLSWSTATGAASYNIYRSTTNGGPYTSITNVAATSYVNSGLISGTTYYYAIKAKNNIGLSAYSNQASATPIELAAPANLTATAGSAQAVLSWSAGAGATGYNVYRATTIGGPYTFVTDVVATNYLGTGLTNGASYYFVVKAKNGAVLSVNSNEAATTPIAAPGAVQFGDVTRTTLTATLPALPTGAATLTLQKKQSGQGDSSYVNVAAGLAGGAVVPVTGLSGSTVYVFRCAAVNASGQSFGAAVSVTTASDPPNAAATPAFSSVTTQSVRVTAPLLPSGASWLTLQSKFSEQDEAAYQSIATQLGGAAVTDVNQLNASTTYTFRYVAQGPGGSTAGAAANLTTASALVSWQAGQAISCSGIRWPLAGANIPGGGEGHLNSFLATDWDQRDAITGTATISTAFSDPCTYTWSAGTGSFKNGINTGQKVIWIAPTLPGTYTLNLVVDDQGGLNQGAQEGGSRNDGPRGYNDDPLRFSVTVTVMP